MFARKNYQGKPISPARTHLDAQWFARYWGRIIAESSVDPEDEGNHIELTLFTLNLLDSAASDYMSQLGDPRAFLAYQEAMQNPDNCTAEAKVALMAGWNAQTLPLIQEKLNAISGTLISAGKKFGYLRFFPSKCHGERRVYSEGHPVCSVCKQPADF